MSSQFAGSLYDPYKKLEENKPCGVHTKGISTSLDDVLKFDPEKLPPEYGGKHPASLDLEKLRQGDKVDAQIIECDRAGRYRLASYDETNLLHRLKTSKVVESAPLRQLTMKEAIFAAYGMPLREDADIGLSYDSINSTEPFAAFTPLFMGPYYRQQYMYKMLEAKSKCFDAFTYNPVGRRIPNMITQFTLGKGVTATCKSPRTKEVWDEFASYNKLGTSMSVGLTRAGSRLRMWSNQLSVDGELMIQFITKKDKLTRKPQLLMRSLDTATILEIVTDPEDIDDVLYYHQQYVTQYQIYLTGSIPSMKYIIRQIPGSDVLHVKINTFENEKRGRSDLYSILGWMKRMKDLVNANVIKAYFQACSTWDYAIDGSPTFVSSVATANTSVVPTPGSSYFHNKNITRTLIGPTSSAGAGADSDMMGLMNLIAMGCGLPPAYLIGSMSMNRAQVLAETEPATKFFFERQSTWDEALHSIFDRLAKWHYEQFGEKLDENIEFSFPPINAVDKLTYISALERMVMNKWFAPSRAAELAAKDWNVTSYSVEEERKKIKEDEDDRIKVELDQNKLKSTAQANLQLWQSILSHNAAKEEQDMGIQTQEGVNDEAQQQGQPVGGAGNPQPSKPGAARPAAGATNARKGGSNKGKADTGGLTDEERNRTKSKVTATGKD